MTQYDLPEKDSTWILNSEHHPALTDVTVVVNYVNERKGSIRVRVTDKELLHQQLQSAEKTYEKNGQDLENALETHPLVKSGKTVRFKIDPFIMFFKPERFHEQCTKQ